MMNTANSVVKIALVAAAAVIGVCSGASRNSGQRPARVRPRTTESGRGDPGVGRLLLRHQPIRWRVRIRHGFRMAPGGRVSILHSFIYGEEGADPTALIQATDGNFYGTTWGGGPQNGNGGTIFKMAADGTLTTLHAFADGADGFAPSGLIQAADGNFYGTTSVGGLENSGSIFRMTSTGAFTVLHRFDRLTEGAHPNTLLEAHDGSFYGTTYCDGPGTAFRMSADGMVSIIHTFTSADGLCPSALIQGADGNFYGTSSSGGTGSRGWLPDVGHWYRDNPAHVQRVGVRGKSPDRRAGRGDRWRLLTASPSDPSATTPAVAVGSTPGVRCSG